MSRFTFDFDNKNKLETWEWDNVWWEHPEDDSRKRVLYIGDSISCGTRTLATEMSDGKFYFDGFATSKALDNPFFNESLNLFLKQMNRCDAVIFSNGLHGWHIEPEEYKALYKKEAEFLLETIDAPLFLVKSTDVLRNDEKIAAYNRGVEDVAKELNLPVIDLQTVAHNNEDLFLPDGVHFTEAGYRKIAECILEGLKDL